MIVLIETDIYNTIDKDSPFGDEWIEAAILENGNVIIKTWFDDEEGAVYVELTKKKAALFATEILEMCEIKK